MAHANAAEPTGTLLWVQREQGSEACPDADTVFRALQTLYPERAFRRVHVPEQAAASAQIVVRPSAHGHAATVKVLLPRPGERVIVEQDPSCGGLGDALAVAVSMLLEPKPEAEPGADRSHAPPPATATEDSAPGEAEVIVPATVPAAPSSPKSSATPHQPNPATPAPRAQRASWSSWNTHARVAALGQVSVLTEPALGAVLGGDLFHASGLGVELGALGLWAQPAREGQGSISVSRFGARLGVCYQRAAFIRGKSFVCVEFAAGSQRATTSDFSVVYERTRYDAWATLAPKLGYVQGLSAGLDGFVSAGIATNLVRHNLVVAGDPSLRVEAQLLGISAEIGLRLIGPRF